MEYDRTKHIKISASSLSAALQCPRRWYYRYIARLYPEVPKEPFTEFGKFVHEVAERMELHSSLEDFKKLAIECKSKYEIHEEYKHKISPAIKNLFVYFNNNFKKDDYLGREYPIDVHYKGIFFLTGKIDLVRIRGSDVKVIDWKTSKKSSDHELQLSFYKVLLKNDTKIKYNENILNGEIVYLASDEYSLNLKSKDYKITQDDEEDVTRKINNLISMYDVLGTENIENWRKKIGPLCKYCDYYKSGHCDGKECS